MELFYHICLFGLLCGHVVSVPVETALFTDGYINTLVESALTYARIEKEKQSRIDLVMLQKGYDEAKHRKSRALLSTQSQLSDIFKHLKNSTTAECEKAFLVTQSTFYLTKKLDTTVANIYKDPRITKAWRKVFRPYCKPRSPDCPSSTMRYRTIDGSCNNRRNPTWGMTNRPEKRFLSPAYDDGVSSPRTLGRGGRPLPSPREVSNVIHNAVNADLTDCDDSAMVMQFGQLIDHDLVDTPMLNGKDGATLECCKLPSGVARLRHACFSLKVPGDDRRFKQDCMNFARSGDGVSDDCCLGERNQINQLSSYFDASFLYGSDRKTEHVIRAHVGGRLVMTKDGFFSEHENPNNCIKENSEQYCMKAGDRRIHITPTLTATIVMFLRQHNLLADSLATVNPNWTDKQLYQTTREIIAAITQHITYTEYLPSILDPTTMERYGLKGSAFGHDTRYDISVDATVANAFAAAAFRFGHSQIPNLIQRVDSKYQATASNLSEHLNRPALVYSRHGQGYHDLSRWLSYGKGTKSDRFLERSVRDYLFLDAKGNSFDLAALNIQRGRDHGLPGYNAWRRWSNLPEADNFVSGPGGFTDIDPKVVDQLSSIYEHPDDIDLFTGGIAERHIDGASVGPTFAGIIGQQFKDLKYGDRFWYENNFPESGYTEGQLNSIKQFSLAKLVCNTVDIQLVQKDMFKVPEKSNKAVPCSTILDIDITLWKDPVRPHDGISPYTDGVHSYRSERVSSSRIWG